MPGLKDLIRYPIDLRRAQRLLANQTPVSDLDDSSSVNVSSQRPVVLKLMASDLTIDCGRHLMTLCRWAETVGSDFLLCCPKWILARIARKIHGRELLAEPGIQWIAPEHAVSKIPSNALILSDHTVSAADVRPQQIVVRMLVGRSIDRSLLTAPYPMHPATLAKLEQQDIQGLRNQPRSWMLFFAGNQKQRYGNDRIETEFGVTNRLRILHTVKTSFPTQVRHDLPGAGESAGMVLLDSQQHSIRAADWLPTIANAQFFLCCPGTAQPICHNLIESMSIGVIPVIEYGDRLTPRLQDGVNAICFRGPDGLQKAIDRIRQLTPSAISNISQRVVEYYDEFLCGKRFMSRLHDLPSGTSTNLCMPIHECDLFSKLDTESQAA